jgi:hypothetical protein
MLFKDPARTSKRTPHFTITGINWLMLIKEIMTAYSENYKNVTLENVKADGSCNYRSALKG